MVILEKIKNGYSVIVHYGAKDNNKPPDDVTTEISPIVAEKTNTYSKS